MAEQQNQENTNFLPLGPLDRPPECCCGPCGCDVQSGTKIIAIFSLMGNAFMVILFIVMIINGQTFGLWESSDGFGKAVTGLVAEVLKMPMNTFLLLGAQQANPKYCRWWVIYNKVWIIISLALAILFLVQGNKAWGWVGVPILISMYFISVVKSFVTEVENNPLQYYKGSNTKPEE